MYIATTDNIANREIKDVIGLVMSTEICSLRVMLAGEESGKEYIYNESLKKAKLKLRNNASKLGANAVIGVKTNITTSAELGVMLTLTGTAVVLDGTEEEKLAEKARLEEEAKQAERARADEMVKVAAKARAEAYAKAAEEIKAAQEAKAEAEAKAAEEIKLAEAKAAEEIKQAEAVKAEAQNRAMAEARALLESKVAAERANVEAKAAEEVAAEEAKVKALEEELESALEIANKALEERNQLLMEALSKIESLEKANQELKSQQAIPTIISEPIEERIEENLEGIDDVLEEAKRKKTEEINEADVRIVDVIYGFGKPVSASNIQEKVSDMSMLEVLTALNKLVEQGVVEREDGLYSLVNRARLI